MHTPSSKWDIERAAAWLRRHAWGEGGVTPPAPSLAPLAPPAEPALPEGDEDIDIAGWPALVAPFYD